MVDEETAFWFLVYRALVMFADAIKKYKLPKKCDKP
jgi:hypothetical protein